MNQYGQDKISEQRYYDNLFKTRRRFDQFQVEIYQQLATEARRGTNGTLVLDLGCGSGTQALCLSEQGFSVIAADLSLEAVKLTSAIVNRDGQPILVANADAEKLPIPNGSIDACICGLLLHHFKKLDLVAAELKRVIRPGGVVVALDANAHNPFTWLFFNFVHRVRPLSGLTPNQRALWRSEIKQIFGANSFGEFRFASMTSQLRRDWLGNSLGARLNYITRRLVLGLSKTLLPEISHGNMLLSVFHRLPDAP